MLGSYYSDLGSVHHATALEVRAITEGAGSSPATFIPPSIRSLFEDADWGGCEVRGLQKRALTIDTTALETYRIEIPVAPWQPLWPTWIAELANDPRIAAWRIAGERQAESRIELLL